jgi:hypothetical protein
MIIKSIARIALAATLAGAAGWVVAPPVAQAVNPDSGFQSGLFTTPNRSASTATKSVTYRVISSTTECRIDVISSTSFTTFGEEAIMKCTGEPNSQIPSETNSSPITSVDDMGILCNGFFNSCEGVHWGVQILN